MVNCISLTKEELLNLSRINQSVILELFMSAFRNNTTEGPFIIEDELGGRNRARIMHDTNSTWFYSEGDGSSYSYSIKRVITILFRQKVEVTDSIENLKIKRFDIVYKSRNNDLIGNNKVFFGTDGKTISFADYWYNDGKPGCSKEGHFENSYEKVFMQGIIQNRVKDHADKINKEHKFFVCQMASFL